MLYVLKVQEIRELIKLVDNSSLVEFVYELDGSKIKLKKFDVKEYPKMPEIIFD